MRDSKGSSPGVTPGLLGSNLNNIRTAVSCLTPAKDTVYFLTKTGSFQGSDCGTAAACCFEIGVLKALPIRTRSFQTNSDQFRVIQTEKNYCENRGPHCPFRACPDDLKSSLWKSLIINHVRKWGVV